MQITKQHIAPTRLRLTIISDESELATFKRQALEHVKTFVKVPGFRAGTAPLKLVESHVDQNYLQATFLDKAVNALYQRAITDERIKPLSQPQITLKKYEPYTILEFEAVLNILGKFKLANYKQINRKLADVTVSEKEINDVIAQIAKRAAVRKPLKQAAVFGHEVVIDFCATNHKGERIKGIDSKNYPLELGSNSFIPGFEKNIVGLKAGEATEFRLTFPKDYGVLSLANQMVTFHVTVKAVNSMDMPAVNDEFAATVGPFKTLKDLKSDIKKQLMTQKQKDAERTLANDIIQQLVNDTELDLPESLVSDQIERLKTELTQSQMYYGQTWQEILKQEGLSDEEYINQRLRPEAQRCVKTSLILAEVASLEKLRVDEQELDAHIAALRAQYKDSAMQAELAKPRARHDIASQLLAEKTVRLLVQLATKGN